MNILKDKNLVKTYFADQLYHRVSKKAFIRIGSKIEFYIDICLF